MPKSRILYNCLGAYCSPSPATGYCFSSGNSGVNLIQQLSRVQSVTDSFSVDRQDVGQLGNLGLIDRVIVQQPSVPLEVNWLVSDVSNERMIGLYASGDQSAIVNLINNTQDEKNYFLAIAPEGTDIYGYTGQSQVIQFNNAFLASYKADGSVGSIPTASATFEALNWSTSTGSINQTLNSINVASGTSITGVKYTIPVGVSGLSNTVSAIRPQGIVVDIQNAAIGLSISDLQAQSYSVSLNIPRENLMKLGSFYAYKKVIKFPAEVQGSVTAYFGDLTESNLQSLVCNDSNYDITIKLQDPACTGYGAIAAMYQLKQVKLDSQSFSNLSYGATAAQVTLNYSTKISAETNKGLFISGRS
jgi:hypothetical protein